MYFYIDESGQTGKNLLDESQPNFYYGLLSSSFKLEEDENFTRSILDLKNKFNVTELHSNELGLSKVGSVIYDMMDVLERFNVNFNLYILNKRDFIIVNFFDQVFDQGINNAVPYIEYWSPCRYVNLYNLRELFDNDMLHKAWQARICKSEDKSVRTLISVIDQLLENLQVRGVKIGNGDIIRNALIWARENPKKLLYNFVSEINGRKNNDILSPNSVLFQLVLFGIAKLTPKDVNPVIYVDEQEQFNKYQTYWTMLYKHLRERGMPPTELGIKLATFDITNTPMTAPVFMDSANSIGLEIVDMLIWITKKFIENRSILPEKLANFIEYNIFNKMKYCGGIDITALFNKGINDMKEQLELIK